MKKNILIVENDLSLQTLLSDYFTSIEYDVFLVSKGSEVKEILKVKNINAVILDVMLDDMDGWSVLRGIKKDFDIPVIMLTARSEEEDKIFGLELGADDYITKPFSFVELRLRMEKAMDNRPIHKS